MPSRKIPMNHLVVTGKSVGRTRMVGFEGDLERDLYLLLRFDPDVADFEEQPVTLRYTALNGREYNYTPDVRVTFRSSRPITVIEVKPSRTLQEDAAELEPKFAAAHNHTNARGEVFEVWTEREIRTPRLKNLEFLEVYDRLHPNEPDRDALLEAVRSLARPTPRSVLDCVAVSAEARDRITPTLWHLVLKARIRADLDLPLSMSSRLSLSTTQTEASAP
jgi:TnsA endonuclease N terminal